ncbi:hypothetical protein [Streptomyces sp. I05A-00742]|uniref:hypothetical protein n=1 Tax=Streptomyces sp. I05A-00742 TaxID=2732853 RepID=UPI0014884429|nr:hypothetical protein [Streptomyces sp. I05A-00742]
MIQVEEWWCRHVTRRNLYRHWDACRRAGIASRSADDLTWLMLAFKELDRIEQRKKRASRRWTGWRLPEQGPTASAHANTEAIREE